ncbi:FxDxF family PEP-CTERM protein [Massilia aquatica]|uniref:FxDxF family PEP-CTERM protein n=1 Tax=Massilia aquatica TaxID=2609000 RepID=UPI0016522C5D|nr:FxDxF family PEP-CTERM protein [Massilia aquatica]
MSNTSSRLAYCALAAAAIATGSAHAQSISTSASISQFSYQLVDLDLSDNISPSIFFTEHSDSSFSYFTDAQTGKVTSQSIGTLGSTSASHAGGTASTSTDAANWGSTTFANATAPTRGTMQAGTFHLDRFKLSPNTGMIISALGTVSNDVSNPAIDSRGWAYFSLKGRLGDQEGQTPGEEMTFYQSYYARLSGTKTYTVSAYLESGSTGGYGHLEFETNNVAAVISAVPEPETYAMLLAGLAMMGWCARRRKAAR